MMRLGINFVLTVLLVWLAGPTRLAAAKAGDAPEFREVYEVILAHLAGASEAELNRAAVQGLVANLGSRVTWLTNGTAASQEEEGSPVVSRSNVFDEGLAYIRVGRVGAGLAEAVRSACRELGASNALKGVVLDLRFAGGSDYAAAAATSDVFLNKERPLLNWGAGVVQSKAKTNAVTVPVAALVNQHTAGAAEALAAVLRETGSGLVLGSQTAGEALIVREYALKNGGRLRIATAPVQLGDGTALAGAVKPDIAVAVDPVEERSYYTDAFKVIAPRNPTAAGLGMTNQANGTNSARRPRYNEAELVRERHESLNPDAAAPAARRLEPEQPLVRDPVLARALDLLKGLAVIRQARS